jgi:1,4-dihydroxy-2-naphthoate octaprenyltransferase
MKSWIEAARPRTLPLALSSILMGSFLAIYQGVFDRNVFILACLTTILLQVLSNFANDYGDTQNGADQTGRVGPQRAVQSGEISSSDMFKAIILFVILSLISGIMLLYFAFRNSSMQPFWYFFALGILCIIASYTYTAGKKPYGYAGLGDVSVLVFFGLVGVLGSNYLFTHRFVSVNILPALSCGFLATGVLNLNNIRDIQSDIKAGKLTIPARIGHKKAVYYQWFLLAASMICMISFALIRGNISWYFMAAFPFLVYNAMKVKKLSNPDPLLKKLALTTLLFVIFSGISYLF